MKRGVVVTLDFRMHKNCYIIPTKIVDALDQVIPNKISIQMLDIYNIRIKFRIYKGQSLDAVYKRIAKCLKRQGIVIIN